MKILEDHMLVPRSRWRLQAAPRRKRRRRRTSSWASAAANSLYYLPLALTEKLGFFKEQGLNVEINDFKGGSQSLQALVSNSVDVVTGAYEHTLRMQAKGQEIVAAIELGRYPGISLAVKKDRMDKIKSIADLKGARIGVTAPGSSTNMIAQYLMVKAGLKPDDASFIGVGAGPGAVAAMQQGRNRRDLQHRSHDRHAGGQRRCRHHGGYAHDRRRDQGVRRHDVGCRRYYRKRDFIDKNPNTVQALVNAFYKTLLWMRQGDARADHRKRAAGILARRQGALHGRRQSQLQIYSRDGIVSEGSQQRSIAFLQAVRQGDGGHQVRAGEDLRRPLREKGGDADQVAARRAESSLPLIPPRSRGSGSRRLRPGRPCAVATGRARR